MNRKTNKDKLIHAICNLDVETISNMMDENELHFGCYKHGAVTEIKSVFAWIRQEFSEYTMEAMPWDCEKHSQTPPQHKIMKNLNHSDKDFFLMVRPYFLCQYDLCDKPHKNTFRFTICQHNFIWDITETKNGKFKLDICEAFIGTDYYTPIIFGSFKDFRPEFEEDAGVLLVRRGFKKVMWPVNSGEIVFWFPEDLQKWKDSLRDVEDSLYAYFNLHCFKDEFIFKIILDYINKTTEEECEYKNALQEFDELQDGIIMERGSFHIKYFDILDFEHSDLLDLSQINNGYFTIKLYPNLRLSSKGFELFLTFVEKIIKPYNQQKRILCTLLPFRKKENECNENELEIPF